MKTKVLLVGFILILCFTACKNDSSTGEKIELLPAPKNFKVAGPFQQNGYIFYRFYTFDFLSVEKAISYMLYYSTKNDTSTAESIISGTGSPLQFKYTSGSGTTCYFWVRAYDGKNYGNWSNCIEITLY